MSKGAIVAVLFWGVVLVMVGYGLTFDIRRWWHHRQAERHAGRWLAAMNENDRQEIELRIQRVLTDPESVPEDEEWEPPLIARTDAQLERLINMPAAPNPKLRVP